MLVLICIFLLYLLFPWWVLLALLAGAVAGFFLLDADLSTFLYHRFAYKKLEEVKSAFTNKVVLVTGASSGIGESVAMHFAAQGARVILAARRAQELERVRAACANPDRHVVMPLDLTAVDTHETALKNVIDSLGGGGGAKIDMLVCNAGRTMRGLVSQTKGIEVDKALMDLNYLGTINLAKLVQAHMIETKNTSGQIAVISSIAGVCGSPGSAPYAASKGAVNLYFKTMAIECVTHGIRILTVEPGPIVSEGADNAITATGGRAADDGTPKPSYDKNRVETARFASLFAAAMHANAKGLIQECVISKAPELLFTYLAQYSPLLYGLLSRTFGPKRCEQYLQPATEAGGGASAGGHEKTQ